MNELNQQFIKWETFLQLTSEDEVPVVKFDPDGINVATMRYGRKFINTQHKEALYRIFQYPNGYIIKFEGNYERDGLIRRIFIDDSLSKEELEKWKNKFNEYEFDVRFADNVKEEDIKKYEIDQGKIFKERDNFYYRQNIDYENKDEDI
ncbi:18182_t:CDS:2 [Funneliformis geosporum]|nr:18182_t:CDS:2 [Funneliformis geosporum]